MAAYGFLANLFFGGLYWAVPRLTGERVWKRGVSLFLFWAWQGILVATFVGQMFGFAQGVEWAETPIFIDPVVVIGVLLMTANFYVPILRTKEKPLYVSLWYFTAAFVWTGLVYIMGIIFHNFLHQALQVLLSADYTFTILSVYFVTPLGWGMMYYFCAADFEKANL